MVEDSGTVSPDPEKRIQKIVDELLRTPKLKSPASSLSSSCLGKYSRGRKHLETAQTPCRDHIFRLNLQEEDVYRQALITRESQTPLCRPWSREDLMRRMATFKSMTWFAKPKAVSPLNCARRGWVNINMDSISCEACGACILFSTHPSWSQEQVEKAAAVFSLKLDSGHKPLCPWVDNICNESLGLFPLTSGAVLIERYKGRCSAILQLSALPVISFSSIECMHESKLRWFLEEYSNQQYIASAANNQEYSHEIEQPRDGANICNQYHQVLKLIALCGWEPNALPYIVDYMDESKHSGRDGSQLPQDQDVILLPKDDADRMPLARESDSVYEALDSSAATLNCQLCGATVGLWAFLTIPPPLELVHIMGYSKVIGQQDSPRVKRDEHIAHSDYSAPSIANPCLLTLSIAGGPPPAKQTPRPTVSLPVVGRLLRTKMVSENLDHRRGKDKLICHKEPVHFDWTDKVKKDVSGKQYDSSYDNTDANMHGEQLAVKQDTSQASDSTPGPRTSELFNEAEGTRLSSDCVGYASEVPIKESACAGSSLSAEKNIFKEIPNSEDGHSAQLTCKGGQLKDWTLDINNEIIEASGNSENSGAHACRSSLTYLNGKRSMKFDPIKQHRYFCPWVASSNDTHLPGWQLTLTALFKASSSHDRESLSDSFKVDDAVTSVQKLLTSSSLKKRRLTR